jgi:hypothetical protein
MNNHIHLLIETQKIPLSKFMQGVSQTYTIYFNRRYRTVGHLFQGRYKAILCDQDAYLLGLVKYIHRNPVRARIVERLDAYPWSSHHAYTGKSNPLSLVDTDQVLRMFSENKVRSRMKYREFMMEKDGYERNEVYATIDQRLKGDDEFVDRVLAQHDKVSNPARTKKLPLDDIAKSIEQRYGISVPDLRSSSRTQTLARARKVFSIAAKGHGHKAKEIALYLEKDPTLMSIYIREAKELADDVQAVEADLQHISSFKA